MLKVTKVLYRSARTIFNWKIIFPITYPQLLEQGSPKDMLSQLKFQRTTHASQNETSCKDVKHPKVKANEVTILMII